MARYPGHGKFLRSRADQLAEYLRGCIARGELREPFPNIRALRSKLGVGLHTLEMALRILERQSVLRIRPRQGIQILRGSVAPPNVPQPDSTRVVRWLYYGRDFPDMSAAAEILLSVSERLLVHGIRLNVEKCDAVRLKAIQRAGENMNEMLLLVSLTEPHQRLFADFRKSALILGLPFPGVRLPYVSVDSLPAITTCIFPQTAWESFGGTR